MCERYVQMCVDMCGYARVKCRCVQSQCAGGLGYGGLGMGVDANINISRSN